jgi:hypothetical protein
MLALEHSGNLANDPNFGLHENHGVDESKVDKLQPSDTAHHFNHDLGLVYWSSHVV